MAAVVATRIDPFGNRKSSPKGKASPEDDPLPTNQAPPVVSPSGDDEPAADSEPTPPAKPSAADPVPELSSQPEPPAPEPTSDRNKAGQFQKGCRPGPGNPFAKQTAALRKALLESVSEADLGRLGQKLLAQAMAGDVAATKLLLSYTVGRPTEAVDPDRLALDALKLVMAWPSVSEMLAGLSGVRPEIAAEVVALRTPETPEAAMKCAAELAHLAGAERIRVRRETKGK